MGRWTGQWAPQSGTFTRGIAPNGPTLDDALRPGPCGLASHRSLHCRPHSSDVELAFLLCSQTRRREISSFLQLFSFQFFALVSCGQTSNTASARSSSPASRCANRCFHSSGIRLLSQRGIAVYRSCTDTTLTCMFDSSDQDMSGCLDAVELTTFLNKLSSAAGDAYPMGWARQTHRCMHDVGMRSGACVPQTQVNGFARCLAPAAGLS